MEPPAPPPPVPVPKSTGTKPFPVPPKPKGAGAPPEEPKVYDTAAAKTAATAEAKATLLRAGKGAKDQQNP